MGILNTFSEIAKNETVRRSKLPGLVRDMRNDIVDHRRKKMKPDSPAVDADTSRSDFAGGYKILTLMSLVSFAYIIGVALYLMTAENVQNLITMVCMMIIGVLWHVSFCLRALRARRVAESWTAKSQPMKVSYSEFFDEVLGDPLTLTPFLKPLNFSSGNITGENQG